MNILKKLASARQLTGRRDTDAIQQAAKQTAERVNGMPFAAGVLRSVRLLAGVGKTVDHGLGTRATFIIVRTNYDGTGVVADVVESASSLQGAVDLTKQLSVVASADCTVDLWFYPIASEVVAR